MKVEGKVIVVTGAGSGIGRELTYQLLNKGAQVFAVDKNANALKVLVDNCPSSLKSNLFSAQADLINKEEVESLPEKAITQFGHVDGIINNAGMIQPFVRINDLDFEKIELVMKVNFYSQLYMIKSFLPHLLKRNEAHILNISSMGGFLPVPGQSIYGAAKAAVKLMTESLYAELMHTNVRVTVVFPGAVDTNIAANSGVEIKMENADAGSMKTLEASAAAQQIIQGMERNKSRLFVGKDSKMMNRLYSLAPDFTIKLITKQMKGLLK